MESLIELATKKIKKFPDYLNQDGYIKTPEEYFPEYEKDSMGFRMGPGESYSILYAMINGEEGWSDDFIHWFRKED